MELAIFLSSSPVETARAKFIEFGRGAEAIAAAADADDDDDVQCMVGGGVVLSIISFSLSTMLPPLLPLPMSSAALHIDEDDVVGPSKCGCVE